MKIIQKHLNTDQQRRTPFKRRIKYNKYDYLEKISEKSESIEIDSISNNDDMQEVSKESDNQSCSNSHSFSYKDEKLIINLNSNNSPPKGKRKSMLNQFRQYKLENYIGSMEIVNSPGVNMTPLGFQSIHECDNFELKDSMDIDKMKNYNFYKPQENPKVLYKKLKGNYRVSNPELCISSKQKLQLLPKRPSSRQIVYKRLFNKT